MGGIVVVAPHPDDEVIGCGGTLIQRSRLGESITVLTLGARLSSSLEGDLTDEDYRCESAAALARLGVRRHVTWDLPARDLVMTRALLLRIVREYRADQPDTLFVPHAGEVDREHVLAHEAALEALWMAQSPYFDELGPPMPAPRQVLTYEVWTPMSRFAVAVDIGDALEHKVAAMKCYASQLRQAAWDEAISGLAAYRGVLAFGRGYAEVFGVVQSLLHPSCHSYGSMHTTTKAS